MLHCLGDEGLSPRSGGLGLSIVVATTSSLPFSLFLRLARFAILLALCSGVISFFGFFRAMARAAMTGTGAMGLGAQPWQEGGRDLGGK